VNVNSLTFVAAIYVLRLNNTRLGILIPSRVLDWALDRVVLGLIAGE
jgi:hypothetical protein